MFMYWNAVFWHLPPTMTEHFFRIRTNSSHSGAVGPRHPKITVFLNYLENGWPNHCCFSSDSGRTRRDASNETTLVTFDHTVHEIFELERGIFGFLPD